MKNWIWILLFAVFVSSCTPPTSWSPIIAALGEPFTLAPGQSATIANTGLTITFKGAPDDSRCPLKIECAESGPVTVTITVQSGDEAPRDFTLQSFTDNNGLIPEMGFQGMTAKVEAGGFVIRLKSVLPFPQKSFDEIADAEYRASFVAMKE